jgi:hypothetical protein
MTVKTRISAVVLTLAFMIFLSGVLAAQVMVSGRMAPGMPERLNAGDSFSVSADASLILRFPHGATMNLIAPSAGKIASEGVSLTHGACFVRCKKAVRQLLIKTSLAILAGSDCQYFLQISPERAKVSVVGGVLKGLTRDLNNISVKAGETLVISASQSEVRRSAKEDLAFWKNDPAKAFDKVELPARLPKRFGEIYIYSMAILQKGGGKVVFADPARVSQSAVDKDLMVKAGSKIITGASETASLRLGEKTLVRIAPDSEILLKSSQFEVLKGTCLVRHGNVLFPVKIGAPVPMLVTKGSSVELVRIDNAIIATVYNGSLQLPSTGESLCAGFSFRISDRGSETLDFSALQASPLFADFSDRRSWTPEDKIFRETFDEADPFSLSDESPEKPVIQNQPSPGSLLQQYEVRPEGGL